MNAPKQCMPLSQYLARAGICSRRNAGDVIKQGLVKINGIKAANPGIRVSADDRVEYQAKTLHPESFMYILINKPAHIITSLIDPEGRPTIINLLPRGLQKRLYPVGRLDRETTGVLLLTNDGDMAQKLTHPRYGVRKTYQVQLNRPLAPSHLEQIKKGIMLEDGMMKVDAILYASQDGKSVRISIHSGKKRIIRRIFQAYGYIVKKLDRPQYAGLSKRGLAVGEWRYLTKKEVAELKKRIL